MDDPEPEDKSAQIDAALEGVQKAERAEVADDIARQQATDERIVAALARPHDPAAEA